MVSDTCVVSSIFFDGGKHTHYNNGNELTTHENYLTKVHFYYLQYILNCFFIMISTPVHSCPISSVLVLIWIL